MTGTVSKALNKPRVVDRLPFQVQLTLGRMTLFEAMAMRDTYHGILALEMNEESKVEEWPKER